eukprot:TRINITY_DN23205_c0_g1_i1.p1 TRINITY_DN23205_c0_g1~~TRINITY_DN23205_c0_g1_i1.p1  ORF type:complete len:394 (-),score=140.54 TRINITY_DN23205_c0_g1_i1:143-1324(-)
MEMSAYVIAHNPRLQVGQSPSVTCQSHAFHGKRSGEGNSRGFTALASTTAAAFSALASSRSVARGRDRQLIKRRCRTATLELKLRESESKLRAALSAPRAEKELAEIREKLRVATDELRKERKVKQDVAELKEELASAHARLKTLADADKAVAALETKLKDADKKLRVALLAPRAEKQVLDLKEQLKEAHKQLASKGGSQTIVAEETSGLSQRIADLEAELKDAKAQILAQEALQQQLDQSEKRLVELEAKLDAADAKQAEAEIAQEKRNELMTVARSDDNCLKKLEAAQAAAAEFETALKLVQAKAGDNLFTLQRSQAEASKLRLELGLVADERFQLLQQSKALQKKLEQAEQRASAAEVQAKAAESKLQKLKEAPLWKVAFRRQAIGDDAF